MKVTHFGTATLLIEVATAKDEDAIGDVDAVLLSHDQHGDNLDDRGRAVLARAPKVIA